MKHLKDITKERGIRCNRWNKGWMQTTEDITKVTCKTCKGERGANRFVVNPRTLKVGDIVSSSWGYDQTNVNFYQITKLIGKQSVELREVKSRIERDETYAVYVVAIKDAFIEPTREWDKRGRPMVKRANGSGVSLSSYEYASLWNGQPQYETATGYGH